MELTDARFAIREEVFVAHLVDHGAAVIIQKWWRALPWRMRRLRCSSLMEGCFEGNLPAYQPRSIELEVFMNRTYFHGCVLRGRRCDLNMLSMRNHQQHSTFAIIRGDLCPIQGEIQAPSRPPSGRHSGKIGKALFCKVRGGGEGHQPTAVSRGGQSSQSG